MWTNRPHTVRNQLKESCSLRMIHIVIWCIGCENVWDGARWRMGMWMIEYTHMLARNNRLARVCVCVRKRFPITFCSLFSSSNSRGPIDSWSFRGSSISIVCMGNVSHRYVSNAKESISNQIIFAKLLCLFPSKCATALFWSVIEIVIACSHEIRSKWMRRRML